ncbi:protein Tob1-like isoform X2 [Artemia franciscana]|uniref:protein Tob1-like isoform X2 n=1 Tax=Artemia franciscana TaxID=6661 RepID=UPI0032DBE483
MVQIHLYCGFNLKEQKTRLSVTFFAITNKLDESMHLEVQVALNFVISYLYNKLPRRRVNLFGEELERAMKERFQGHWYPERPQKGSAFRCLRTGEPDLVLERAARESGLDLSDLKEHLPQEMSVWVDPGEVSYRIGERGTVSLLYSESRDTDDCSLDKEVKRAFNPDAKSFQPITDDLSSSLNSLSLTPKSVSPFGSAEKDQLSPNESLAGVKTPSPGSSMTNLNGILPRNQPITFTTATFAQTKFGSTKLKTASKRGNRMSPTEFANYIKQRAQQQQMQGQFMYSSGLQPPQRPRSLSPNPMMAPQLDLSGNYLMPGSHMYPHQMSPLSPNPPSPQVRYNDMMTPNFGYDMYPTRGSNQQFNWEFGSGPHQSNFAAPVSSGTTTDKQFSDTISANAGATGNYPGGSYQHLLVAN